MRHGVDLGRCPIIGVQVLLVEKDLKFVRMRNQRGRQIARQNNSGGAYATAHIVLVGELPILHPHVFRREE